MSYILDALKKSEKERQRGTVPDLHATQDVVVQTRKKHYLLLYLIVGALLLNAGLGTWWLARHPKGPAAAAPPTPTPSLAASSAPVPPAPASSAFAPSIPAQKSSGGRSDRALPDEQTATLNPPAAPVRQEPSVREGVLPRSDLKGNTRGQGRASSKENAGRGAAETTPKGTEVKRESSSAGSQPPSAMSGPGSGPPQKPAVVPSKNRLYGLSELPPSVLQDLPGFTISTHLFAADPASRMVRINGQTMHEGESLSAGLKLEQITPDGVVFSYQGFRFRVGLN
ncbi:MAG: general secretion pathway protein GspB [Nitrospirae bacterium]|nr:general secretion pathway protein GspB [Nitrospirota bacterium]